MLPRQGDGNGAQELERIRGTAPRRSPSVRALAAWSAHSECRLATLAFVARVDLDRLLAGTRYAPPFGQSPFAFARGLQFEAQLRKEGHAPTFTLLRDGLGFPEHATEVADVRRGFPKTPEGMRQRAERTRELLGQVLRQEKGAPNLVDGGVLQTQIGGLPASFEADALAAQADGRIHVGEVKSFPVVDGRADPEKLGDALDQVVVYITLLRELVEQMGGNPELVSSEALIITPKNVGLQPTLSTQDVSRRLVRFQRLRSNIPDASELAGEKVTFGPVADTARLEVERLDALHEIAETVGTSYAPACLASCGSGLFCRERAFRAGVPCVAGPLTAHQMPGVTSLQRASQLCRGARPTAAEAPAAALLARAGRFIDAVRTA